MADTAFSISVTPLPDTPARALDALGRSLADLTDFWPGLAESLADTAQARWPLRRRTGTLRRSLRWAGTRLGRGGIYKASSDELVFGTSTFYGDFSQRGTRRQPARKLVAVDVDDTTKRLSEWARRRAIAAGFEVF